jgi:hypothetical protein
MTLERHSPSKDPSEWTDVDRVAWENRKLRAEAVKAESEGKNVSTTLRLQILATLLSTVTTGIAIFALLNANRAQHKQVDETRFYDAVKALQSTKGDVDQSAAVAMLGGYSENPEMRRQMLPVMLSQLLSKNPFLVGQIRDVLLRHPDSSLVAALASQNRTLTRLIERADTLTRGGPVLMRETAFQEYEAVSPPEVLQLRSQIAENARLLCDAMQMMHLVRGVDLSGITLSTSILTFRAEDDVKERAPVALDLENTVITKMSEFLAILTERVPRLEISRQSDTPFDIAGTRFERVSFRGAHLEGVAFSLDTFVAVQFDNARLAGARFSNSTFAGRTTFIGIFVTVPVQLDLNFPSNVLQPLRCSYCSMQEVKISVAPSDPSAATRQALFGNLIDTVHGSKISDLLMRSLLFTDTVEARLDTIAGLLASDTEISDSTKRQLSRQLPYEMQRYSSRPPPRSKAQKTFALVLGQKDAISNAVDEGEELVAVLRARTRSKGAKSDRRPPKT